MTSATLRRYILEGLLNDCDNDQKTKVLIILDEHGYNPQVRYNYHIPPKQYQCSICNKTKRTNDRRYITDVDIDTICDDCWLLLCESDSQDFKDYVSQMLGKAVQSGLRR